MSADEGLVFVDSNVLVYAYDQTAGKRRARAFTLVEGLWADMRGALSIQVLQEFYVTITQKVRSPLDRKTASGLVRDLSHWRVHSPVAEDVLGAIDLQERHILSFWDAMILWSAGQLGCRTVWSEDLDPRGGYNGLQVVNPFREAAEAD